MTFETDAVGAYIIRLPWPPALSRVYGRNHRLSDEAKRFYRAVAQLIQDSDTRELPLAGKLCVEIAVSAPDVRRRDLDNLLKATFDSLEKGGVLHNDCQIKRLLMYELGVDMGGGHLDLCITRLA